MAARVSLVLRGLLHQLTSSHLIMVETRRMARMRAQQTAYCVSDDSRDYSRSSRRHIEQRPSLEDKCPICLDYFAEVCHEEA